MFRMYRDRINGQKRVKKQARFRLIFQILTAALVNGYVMGFAKGKIYTGGSKATCIPVLNCYSCPGAVGACPIGSLQAVLGGSKHNFSFYVIGLIMLFGIFFGRLICGFLCPFGLIQDLLYKLPIKKLKVNPKIDRPARYLKYVILLSLVIVLPIFATNKYGTASPYFCKFLCPAGTLGGAIPLLIANEGLRKMLGYIFVWKFFILMTIIVFSMMISRPFCRYLCPLGALYSLFSRFSLYQIHINKSKCISCKKCEYICPMDVKITNEKNRLECICCGKCKAVCPTNAITSGFDIGIKCINEISETK